MSSDSLMTGNMKPTQYDASGELLLQNGLRVLLTGQCNYNCFFCHNEGLDPIQDSSTEISPELIVRFIHDGARDITFSGGEPLLKFKLLISILELLSELKHSIRDELIVTIVTNGRLLNPKRIEQLVEYKDCFSNLRLNISLHSPDSSTYNTVTGTEGQLQYVEQNIRQALNANLNVKLNFVLLRDHNIESKLVDRVIEYCVGLGIYHIKFIEFLVTRLNRDFYSNFFRIDPLLFNNRYRAMTIEQHSRRKSTHKYTYAENEILVDYSRCTCALGCKDCIRTRELEIAPGNKIIGCIAKQPITFDPLKHTTMQIAGFAAQQLNSMMNRYGIHSPSLASPPEHVAAKAIFSIMKSENVDKLFKSSLVIKFKAYREIQLVHSSHQATDTNYTFLLIESSEETHSIIKCYKEKIVEQEGISWKSLVFLDPIYDFSMTRAEINRKKIKAMGYVLGAQTDFEEDTVLLTDPGTDSYPVLLKRRRILSTGSNDYSLEVLRPEADAWLNDEPSNSVHSVAMKYDILLA